MEETRGAIHDAFSFCWNTERQLWINPPFNLIQQVVDKIKLDKACAILVTPCYKDATWFDELLLLSQSQPFRVDGSEHLFFPLSRDNEKGIGCTPWESTIMWHITARIGSQYVKVSRDVTTWGEISVSKNGIVELKKGKGNSSVKHDDPPGAPHEAQSLPLSEKLDGSCTPTHGHVDEHGTYCFEQQEDHPILGWKGDVSLQ